MKRLRRSWLSGYVLADLKKSQDSRRLTLNIALPFDHAVVTTQMLDRNQQAVESEDGRPITLLTTNMALSTPNGIPFCYQNLRPIQIFGRKRQFFMGSLSLEIPELHWKLSRYVVLMISPATPSNQNSSVEVNSHGSAECVYIEMSCRKLVTGKRSVLFLLISRAEAAKRMNRILKMQPALCGKSHKARSAASSLMIKLFRGGDTPLLTEKI